MLSTFYQSTKLLQGIFKYHKHKSDIQENVFEHSIKLSIEYTWLYNAYMVPPDSLLTLIALLVDCSTAPLLVWASTKQITVSHFLNKNSGKTSFALVQIEDGPTFETICDEAEDEYQSIFESGLWIAHDSKSDDKSRSDDVFH